MTDDYGFGASEIALLRAALEKAARDAAVTNADPMPVSMLHEAVENRDDQRPD